MLPIKLATNFHKDDIPKWKQDLMQRRKSSSKTIVSAGGTLKLTVTRPTNMIKPSARSSTNTSHRVRPHSIHIDTLARSDSGELNQKQLELHSSRKTSEDILVTLDNKIRDRYLTESLKSETEKNKKVDIKLKINDEDYNSDASDDNVFNEGVNAIKDRYLIKCSSPPPVSNLEKKAISLEDICQIDSTRLKPKHEVMRRPCQFKINQYQAKYLETIKGSNNLNQNSSLKSKPVMNGQISLNNSETPTKNLVKQRAQLFESNPQIKVAKPSWEKSKTITVIFKDRKHSFPENGDFSKSELTFPDGTTETKSAIHKRTQMKKNEFLEGTNFSESNMFPELSSLDNCQSTGQKTVACM